MASQRFNAVVVGAGAAGLVSALTLARRGFRVCVLDAGPVLATDARVDLALADVARQSTQSRSTSYTSANASYFVDDNDLPYDTDPEAPFDWFRSRGLGGRLRLWAGVCLRMDPQQFDSWPVTYDDLYGSYETVETLLNVSGTGTRPEVTLTAGEGLVRDALARWPDRRFLSARVAQRSVSSLLSELLAYESVTVLADSIVKEIEVDNRGRATRIHGTQTDWGRSFSIEADRFMLAASTIETLRLMLVSKSELFPRGIGNRHGLLGTNLMDHTAGPSVSGSAPQQPLKLPSRSKYVPVAHIPASYSDGGDGHLPYNTTLFVPDQVPASSESKAWVAGAQGGSVFRMWASGEVLPRAHNRVTLSAQTDSSGLPVPYISLHYSEQEKRMAAVQVEFMTKLAAAAGFEVTEVSKTLLPAGSSVHEVGGAWMGDDPVRSVIDPNAKVWGTENVYVVDGAAFPTSPWQNPTLTMMALAHRACRLLN